MKTLKKCLPSAEHLPIDLLEMRTRRIPVNAYCEVADTYVVRARRR